MPKWRFLFLAFLISLAALTGCAGAWAALVPASEPVTLLFVFSDQRKESMYQDAAKAFNLRHPNLTVKVQRVEDLGRRLSGDGVDAFEVDQFEFGQLLQEKAVLDLTPILESLTDFPTEDFYPSLWDVFRHEGHIWAIPANVDPWVVMYNKDLFDKMEVPYPQPGWDWDDFLVTARSLSKPDQQPPQYGFAPDFYGLGIWAFVYQHGGRLVDSLVQPTKATLDDPRVIEAVQWYLDLAKRYRVMPSVASAGDQWRVVMGAIAQGRIGMWLLPLSERNARFAGSGGWPFALGVVPMPQDKERITFIMASGYCIAAGCEHPYEAWAWLEYLAREADLTWDVPPRYSLARSEAYRKRVGPEIAVIADETAQYGMALPSAGWLVQMPAQSSEFLRAIASGSKTVEEALKEMQRQWNATIQRLSQ